MTAGGGQDPAQTELAELHRRLVLGIDPAAPSVAARMLKPALVRRFQSWKDSPVESVDSVIGEVLAGFIKEPEDYDSSRSPLLPYLYQKCKWALLDVQKARRRQTDGTVSDP